VSGIAALDMAGRDGIARLLARGLTRHLGRLGFAAIGEVVLPNGRRADLMALGRGGEILIIEIKSSVEDFRTDSKWRDYLGYCDRFYFASHVDVPMDIFPQEAGLILADAFGAEILREDGKRALAAPRRKLITNSFARLAAVRLIILTDPEALIPTDF
jgi:hypothetical protein